MNFWEAFFSIKKIILPAAISFGCGLVITIFAGIFKLKLTDIDLFLVLSIGFIIGNMIKANSILNDDDKDKRKR